MRTTARIVRWLGASLAASVALVGCKSSDPDPTPEPLSIHPNDARESVAPRPWTSRFGQPAVLLAEEIYIEGPNDLVEHLVTVQHPELVYDAKTTEEGLRQEIRVASGVGGLEVKAQLDAWELVALKRMVILQRPTWAPVKVRAYGNAWWTMADESDERRDQVLEFVGERGK